MGIPTVNYLTVVLLLCMWCKVSAFHGMSCEVTNVDIKIEPVIRDIIGNSDTRRKVDGAKRHDEIGAISNEKVKEDESVFLSVAPKKNGKRNNAYPREGLFNLNAEHRGEIICFHGNTMENLENMTSQLVGYFGSQYDIIPLGYIFQTGEKREQKLLENHEGKDGFKFALKWNICGFKMTPLDVKKITHKSGVTALPFYLKIFGGDSLQELDTSFVYIREAFKFKGGSTEDHIQIWYNTTRWRYKLSAPFISDHLDYRISLIGPHGNKCNKSLSTTEKALNIYCENSVEEGISMNENTQISFHVFQNYVPNHLFRIILGYSDVFSCNPRAHRLLSWLSQNLKNSLLLYALIVIVCQILPFQNLQSKSLRNFVSMFAVTAYTFLYCPCILLITDVQESVALVYMFYLDVLTWDFGVYWLLCVAWILYPGVMCLLGLLPAVFLVSDIKLYGHFHCFLRSNYCPETCPYHEIKNTDKNSEIISEKIPLDRNSWKLPNFEPVRKIPLENDDTVIIANVPGFPPEKIIDTKTSLSSPKTKRNSGINLGAIFCDVLGLVHCTVYLLSIQCVYFIVTGLFPLYNSLMVAMVFVVMEIYLFLRRRCSSR